MTGIPSISAYTLPVSGQLPRNIPRWTIDPARAVFLIHDMQRYFLRPLRQAGLDVPLIGNLRAIREFALDHDMQVAYTAQPGGMSRDERGLLRDFWGDGMQVAPEDRAVIEELAPEDRDWVFKKWRYSAFWKSDLQSRMRAHGRDQLIIGGVYAHIGILTTALESFSHDIETFVVADATADFTLERHLMALEHAARCCAVVLTTAEVVQ
ncbi:isochorismatase family protein [Dyella sp. 2RAB6]|uniref:isochorismatase family protein n=1 Tax=Dyella sp. 2RAB6 TaxID=3232992 RepID=UPI003F93DB74